MENYKFVTGQLYYWKGQRSCKAGAKKSKESPWKLCIKTAEEKKRILQCCHEEAAGQPLSCAAVKCLCCNREPPWTRQDNTQNYFKVVLGS